MDTLQYSALQEGVRRAREQAEYARDERNFNHDLDLATTIAGLNQAGDVEELLKICKQQGVEAHLHIHLPHKLDTQSEQKYAVATDLAALLFRELFLPPANHAPHAEMLAAILTSLYPDLAPEVLDATDVSDEPANDAETNDLFTAPENRQFRDLGYYKPLSRQKKEIRLVSLHGGKQDQDIQCTLMDPISLVDIQCELQDPLFPEHKKQPPFLALSYAAGDLKKTTNIYVNNVEFEVYESLERALRRIRHQQYAVRVWIDQISIDQHEKAEKAWQVGIMRAIYSSAKQTLVFLDVRGREALGTDFQKFLLMVYNRASSSVINMPTVQPENISISEMFAQRLKLTNVENVEKLRSVLSQQRETAQWLASILLREEYIPAMTFLVKMYRVPWWHRSWVYQELIVSRDVILLCGDKEVNWSAFQVFNKLIIAAASLLQQSTFLPTFHGPGLKAQYKALTGIFLQNLTANQPAIALLGGVRETFMQFGECDIRWLLSIWRDLQSTDPRDKIYAATGIAKSRYRIVPAYTTKKTEAALLVEVAKRSILVDGNFDIILDGGEPNRHTEWNFPTWVPDFTVPNPRKFFTLAPQIHDPRFGKTTSQAGPSPNAEYVFRAMAGLPAEYEFLGDHTTPTTKPSPSPPTSIPRVLRINLVRRWQLCHHELGIIGNLPRFQSIHDKWFRLAYENPLATTTSADNTTSTSAPEDTAYPHTDTDDLTTAYLQTVHFYPDIEAVTSAMAQRNHRTDPKSMTPYDLGAHVDAERILAKGREVQQSGNWRFFCTDDLLMGMVPASTQATDWICFAPGISVPFVLRPHRAPEARGTDVDGDGDSDGVSAPAKRAAYTVVGPAYVHGYMFGKAAAELADNLTTTESADLY